VRETDAVYQEARAAVSESRREMSCVSEDREETVEMRRDNGVLKSLEVKAGHSK